MSNFKHSGKRVKVTSASGTIAAGALVYQEGILGIAEVDCASGASTWIATEGSWYLPVPSGTVKGDKLYADLSSESVSLTLTKTATSNTYVGFAEGARDTANSAVVRLMPSFGGTFTSIRNAQEVTFTESAGAGTYSGSVTVPLGALITNIRVFSTALWAATTSATMIVGDGTDPNGWFDAINLKATDLLVGEELNFDNAGGKNGAYLDTSTGKRAAAYCAAETVVSGSITTVGAAGDTGRTRMVVEWVVPSTTTAATKA